MNSALLRLGLGLAFLLSALYSFSATISGKITDEANEPLPFVSVYLDGTTQGVTSNKEGRYSIELPEGDHRLIFQFIGYKRMAELVHVAGADQKITLNIKMEPQPYEIGEVTVNANAEDPAYEMMRKAIKMRKYYFSQVQSYSCDVYIKGLQRVKSYPKKFMGIDVNAEGEIDPKTGIFYLSESVSKFYFSRPDKVHEVMVSSKVSGNSRAFSYNRTADLLLNFYENVVNVQVISKRGFVSPVAEGAMFYYGFRLAGTFYENGKAVNKIEVLPKRKHDPAFRGYIYICDNTWRIHSTDLYLVKDAGIEFVDTLKINQVHLPVATPPSPLGEGGRGGEVWMLFSNKLTFVFSALGFKGNGLYLGIHSKYNVKVNPSAKSPIPLPTPNTTSPPAPLQGERGAVPKKELVQKKKAEKKENKIFSSGELMKVNDDANKKDSVYWAEMRPVPLTSEEALDYRKKDSIQVVHDSKPYLDSVDKNTNRFQPIDLLFGYSHFNRFKKRTTEFSSLIENVQYNTVQGWVIAGNMEIRRRFEGEKRFHKNIAASYGFSDERVNVSGGVLYEFIPKKFTHVMLQGGRQTVQFNERRPISPFINSLYSLFDRSNYIKLYQKDFLKFSCNSELVNGIYLRSSVEYADRAPLMNKTDFSFVKNAPGGFTSNDPLFPSNDSLYSFKQNQSFELRVNLRLRYRQKYISRPDDKWVYGSKYPTVHLEYRKAVQAFGADADFDLARVSVTDRMNFRLLGKASYLLSAGKFLNTGNMALMDYHHFSGNRTIFSNFDFSDFQLLDYYTHSTQDYFLEGHYEHDFSGFILNKFPLLRKLKLNELAGAHYLYTEKSSHYTEVFFGIEKFNLARADFVMSFSEIGMISSGFRLGLKIGGRR